MTLTSKPLSILFAFCLFSFAPFFGQGTIGYDLWMGYHKVEDQKFLEPLNPIWLAEPIEAENVDAYKKITQSTTTPICTGENHYLAHGFRKMLEIGAVNIIMPDLHKVGDWAKVSILPTWQSCIILSPHIW